MAMGKSSMNPRTVDLNALKLQCQRKAMDHPQYPAWHDGRWKWLLVNAMDLLGYSGNAIGLFLNAHHTIRHYYIARRIPDDTEVYMLKQIMEEMT